MYFLLVFVLLPVLHTAHYLMTLTDPYLSIVKPVADPMAATMGVLSDLLREVTALKQCTKHTDITISQLTQRVHSLEDKIDLFIKQPPVVKVKRDTSKLSVRCLEFSLV